MGLVKKKAWKQRRGTSKIVILAGLIICFVLFLFLLKDLLFINKQQNIFIDRVLLQLNKEYDAVREGDEISFSIREQNIQDVLNELEKLIRKENGFISDYTIKKQNKDTLLVLYIGSGSDIKQVYKIVVKKGLIEETVQTDIPVPLKDQSNVPRICIILDDAGYNNKYLDSVLTLPVKMGIAVLPFLKGSAKTAAMIYEKKKEVLLHMPMEPENYKHRSIRLMSKEIFVSMTDEEIYKVMEEMLNNIKYASGINNHQGSRATSDKRIMTAVLNKVKMMNLFFIDSLTSDKSVTRRAANELGVNYGIRDVFLDNKNDYSYIKNQMEQLIKIALKKGKAVGIGHIDRVNTFRVIRDYIPKIQSRGIEFVYPSEIINRFYYKEVTNNVKDNIIYFN